MPSEIPQGADPKLYTPAEEFMKYSYDILGAYLDALAGISHLREDVIRFQKAKISDLKISNPENASETFMDQQPLSHELEPYSRDTQKLLHRSTQGDFKQRSSSDGLDARLLGYMAITLLYGAWEDVYRERLAIAVGHATKNDLTDDLFGDLGNLRHAIVHNHGLATLKVENSKILRWFNRGQTILISSVHIDVLIDRIDAYITQLCGLQKPKNSGQALDGFSWNFPEFSPSTTT